MPAKRKITKAFPWTAEIGVEAKAGEGEVARLHARRDDLVDALERWKRGATSVWEVVELVEQLRAQHVFPIGLLKLGGADETWDEIVGDVKAALQPAGGDHFDAEN